MKARIRKHFTVWHVDCPYQCRCLGDYSQNASAIANADAHMRKGIHKGRSEFPWEEW